MTGSSYSSGGRSSSVSKVEVIANVYFDKFLSDDQLKVTVNGTTAPFVKTFTTDEANAYAPAEAKTGTDTARAVTAANTRAVLLGLKTISFNGKNGAGAISAVGAVAGDKVIDVFGITSGALGSVDTLYETTITVNDQIQQSSGSDLSTKIYVALLLAVA